MVAFSPVFSSIFGKPLPPAAVENPQQAKYLNLQAAIYTHRQAEYHATVAASDADADKLEASLVTNRKSQAGLEERVKVIGDMGF